MVRSIGEVPYFEVTAEKMLDDIVPAEAGVQFSAYPDKLLRPFGFILNSEYQFCLEVMDESGNTHKLPFVSFSDEIRVSNQRLPRPNLIFRYFKPEVGPEFEPVAEYSGEGSEFVPLYRAIEPTGIFYGRHPNHREPEEPSFYIVG